VLSTQPAGCSDDTKRRNAEFVVPDNECLIRVR
jgi:hypothetical protein